MNTKLTLTIKQSVIESAKRFAKSNGRNLSEIVENYLKVIVKEDKKVANPTPITSKLRGSFKAPADFDYKRQLSKERDKKFL